jgi:hypothetical protein
MRLFQGAVATCMGAPAASVATRLASAAARGLSSRRGASRPAPSSGHGATTTPTFPVRLLRKLCGLDDACGSRISQLGQGGRRSGAAFECIRVVRLLAAVTEERQPAPAALRRSNEGTGEARPTSLFSDGSGVTRGTVFLGLRGIVWVKTGPFDPRRCPPAVIPAHTEPCGKTSEQFLRRLATRKAPAKIRATCATPNGACGPIRFRAACR